MSADAFKAEQPQDSADVPGEPVGPTAEQTEHAAEIQSESQAPTSTSPADSSARKKPWRDNIEAMTVAIVLAVLFKGFILEAYKIPSGSMQPTLFGNEETATFDRILVDKLSFRMRKPTRFEVCVFKNPLDQSRNFVKRLVAIGPEQIKIEHGDLWRRDNSEEPWEIPRRSESVLMSMLKPLDLGLLPGAEQEGNEDSILGAPNSTGLASSRWRRDNNTAPNWKIQGRNISTAGSGTVRFFQDRFGAGSIMDAYLDGYPPELAKDIRWNKGAGLNTVGDLRLEGNVQASPELDELLLELREGARRYRFHLPGPAADANAVCRIEVQDPHRNTVTESEIGLRLAANQEVRFVAQNIDDLLTLRIDGETLAEVAVLPAPNAHSAVSISVLEGSVELTDLQLYRDVYYTEDRAQTVEFEVPADHYFALGDNTQDSSDSREWRRVEKVWEDEDGQTQHAFGAMRYRENPVTVSTLEGRLEFFRDEWGELHHWPAGSGTTGSILASPAIPEHLLLGRALLVFWPYSPKRGLWRQRWIL